MIPIDTIVSIKSGKENVTPLLFDAPKRNDAIIPAALAKAFLNFTFGAPEHRSA